MNKEQIKQLQALQMNNARDSIPKLVSIAQQAAEEESHEAFNQALVGLGHTRVSQLKSSKFSATFLLNNHWGISTPVIYATKNKNYGE